MNNSGPRYKRSLLERRLNRDILWCVALLIVMCLIAAVGEWDPRTRRRPCATPPPPPPRAAAALFCQSAGHGLWLKNLKDPIFQVDREMSPALAAFYVFWTMIIVLQVCRKPHFCSF